MDLFRQSIEFNTLETLEAFMKLSYVKRERFQGDRSCPPLSTMMETMLTRFGFGRQSGQTTAIIEYLKSKRTNRKVLYVAPNRHLVNHAELAVYGNLSCMRREIEFYTCDVNILRGIVIDDDVEIIFDEVPMENIGIFLEFIATRIRYKAKILGMVSVGSQ